MVAWNLFPLLGDIFPEYPQYPHSRDLRVGRGCFLLAENSYGNDFNVPSKFAPEFPLSRDLRNW